MAKTMSKYGFSVGQEVYAKLELRDERSIGVAPGAKLRIVAITPKVLRIKDKDEYSDTKQYFLNLIRSNEIDFWEAYNTEYTGPYAVRIRVNFCCVQKKPLVGD